MRIRHAVGDYLGLLERSAPVSSICTIATFMNLMLRPRPTIRPFCRKARSRKSTSFTRDQIPEDLAHIDVWRSQYDGEILYTDTILEGTFALFEKRGLRPENTIFIITADHGEEFLDKHPGDTGGIGHGRTLYNELIHVPLILSLPNTTGRRTIETAVELNDILPTLIDVLDLRINAGHQAQGRSLMPLIRGEDVPDRPVLSGGRRKRGAIIEDGWKYLRMALDEKGPREPVQGGALRSPIRSRRNRQSHRPRKRPGRSDERALGKALNSTGPLGRPRPVRLDEKTEEQLKSLGYIK